jgi:hypothetical protein
MRSVGPRIFFTFLALSALGGALGTGCGNDAVGVDACRSIENERCRWVVACNIDVGPRRADSTSPVDDCMRYYRDECLHGLTLATSEPSGTQTQACVDAIHAATSCDIVNTPESDPACAFLKPNADGGTEASAVVDAAAEATIDAATDAGGQ